MVTLKTINISISLLNFHRVDMLLCTAPTCLCVSRYIHMCSVTSKCGCPRTVYFKSSNVVGPTLNPPGYRDFPSVHMPMLGMPLDQWVSLWRMNLETLEESVQHTSDLIAIAHMCTWQFRWYMVCGSRWLNISRLIPPPYLVPNASRAH